ncbi:MAG: FAD-dependent oxidoreductase [Clostridiaceae bacterium]
MNKVVYPKEVLDKMKEIVDNCMGDAPPYCEATCPMHTDVKGYVNLIADGKGNEAMKVIREKLFLPGTLGRICAHPCEEKCKRGEMRNPMAIAALKRYAADNFDNEKNWDLKIENENGKKVAVIGAGPAGAQAALDLRKKGYKVTVFEKLPVVGGMMRVGIPEYRLPREVIDFEYSLLNKLGVEFKMGVEVGKDIAFDDIKKSYDAVVIAVGAHKGGLIPVEGSDLVGVTNAVDFLRDASLTHKVDGIGKRIAVIGGGNVAIDVARTARRIGVEEVHLICLEDKPHMPAHTWEVEEAEEEGVKVHDAFGPDQIIGVDGKVTGFQIKKCVAIFDKEGKFNPQFDLDNKKVLDVDNVVFAVGQAVDNAFAGDKLETTRGGRFVVDPITLQTKDAKVFVAGDASGRSVIVIEAMAEGRKAATSVDRYLNGKDMTVDREKEGSYETHLETTIKEDEPNLPRVKTKQLDPKERIKSFVEVDLGFNKEDALKEAARCLKCECKLCMKECVMLNDFCECPKDLFKGILETGEIDPKIPYSCNMCSQCTLACPKDFKMSDRFMEIRKKMIVANNGKSPMKGHSAIEMHQMLGFSKVFNTAVNDSRPAKVKRVFIPGCSLPSYNPEVVGKILGYLQEKYPGTSAILKCCGKPTKALGQVDKFKERYGELQAEIDKLGATEVIVACQSCYLTISECSPQLKVRSLWEVLPEIGLPKEAIGVGKGSDITIAIHDSCPTRNKSSIHDGIRWAMKEMDYKVEEPPHTRENTRCCGFGGMVVPANPELALRIMQKRTDEVKSDYMVTYCAACRESMVKGGKKAVHMLDLIFGGQYNSKREFPGIPGGPIKSWANRYKSKGELKKRKK